MEGGNVNGGLITGFGGAIGNADTTVGSLYKYGAPTTYVQLFNPQFFTHFKVLSDKTHKIFNPTAFDGNPANAGNLLTQGANTAMSLFNPATTVSSNFELTLDFNTYVNKKLVTLAVPTAGTYPQNFPSNSKTYVLILPIVGTWYSDWELPASNPQAAYPAISYNVATQTYCHFRDV